MERPTATALRVGAWRVDPMSGQISRDGETAQPEARTMRLLLYLAEHPGEVVSIEDLLDHVWSGVTVSPDSVYQAVASLRRLLGDDPKQPTYIATVPRLGYRMVAKVSAWEDPPIERGDSSSNLDGKRSTAEPIGVPVPSGSSLKASLLWAVGVALCLVLFVGFLLHGKLEAHRHTVPPATPVPPQESIAVLPFLDLTEGMKAGEFTDGMTEELIDKLTKVPGLQVPPPTSSFFYKDKQIPVADIAKALGVVYVLDGSVRKSGGRLRVAARLIRASSGYVIWSETYDRPLEDILMVQDDIAGEVTKALKTQIEGGQNRDSSQR
jgi:transcriptional activator of cad operon